MGLQPADKPLGEGVKELSGEVVGHVQNPTILKDEVDVLAEVGVVAGRRAVAGQALAEAGVGQGVEGVVDGGEAEPRLALPDHLEEFFGGRVSLGGTEGGVDGLALAGVPEPGGSECVADVWHWAHLRIGEVYPVLRRIVRLVQERASRAVAQAWARGDLASVGWAIHMRWCGMPASSNSSGSVCQPRRS